MYCGECGGGGGQWIVEAPAPVKSELQQAESLLSSPETDGD